MGSAFREELEERGLLDDALAICRPLGLRVDELHARYRGKAFAQARRQMARLLRDRGWSLPMIGKLLRYSDHTTVMFLLGEKGDGAA